MSVDPTVFKAAALAFFLGFWLFVLIRLMRRSKALDDACSRIPLEDQPVEDRLLDGGLLQGRRPARTTGSDS